MDREKLIYILEDMKSCDECLNIKMKGLIGCCQYHLDQQFKE